MTLTVCSLNTERGCRPGLVDYIGKIVVYVDVLLLQEVHNSNDTNLPELIVPKNGRAGVEEEGIRPHLFSEIRTMLGNDFIGLHAPQIEGLHDLEDADGVTYGQAIFVRSSLIVPKWSTSMVFGQFGQVNSECKMPDGTVRGNLSAKSGPAVTLKVGNEYLNVGTTHGPWSMRGKIDMPERFEVNKGIVRMLAHHVGHPHDAKVLFMGDLNYTSTMRALQNLATESIFGANKGGVVLNHQFGVTETRTSYYPSWKPSREADFAIASRALAPHVSRMWADMEAPSDHAAIFAEIDL